MEGREGKLRRRERVREGEAIGGRVGGRGGVVSGQSIGNNT